jgi:uncharacterized protein
MHKEAANLYRDGIKRDSDAILARSFELTRQAAERGHVKSMNNLVTLYRDGEGVKQSDQLAVDWAEKLIAREIGMGYYHMGTFLEQGVGVKADKAKALAYFRRAADLGNAQGQLVAGKNMLKVFVDLPERVRGFEIGRAMLQCALDQGLAEAGYRLALDYEIGEKDFTRALASHQAAARLGHRLSLSSLTEAFADGGLGVQPDPLRANCYRNLESALDADKTKTFPNLDQICPLPPRKMPGS